MRAQKISTRQSQFYLADLDTPVLVESSDDGRVAIRAARNNISAQRKAAFVRQLATEGFIPDSYQWFDDSCGDCGLSWIVDYSWLRNQRVVLAQSNRFMKRLLLGAVAVWLVLMGATVLNGRVSLEVRTTTPLAPSAKSLSTLYL